MATKKRDDQSNQILPSENSTIPDVKNKIENELQHNVNERKTDSTCETESSSDEMRNSSSCESGEIDHLTLGWRKVSDRKMNGKTSDPKERSQEIVNRLFSRLGKDDKISSELKEEKWKKEKEKRKAFEAEGRVLKDQARKKLDGKRENFKKQKSFERLKEQRKSVQLNDFDDKSDQENADQEIEKKDKFCKIKFRREDTDSGREKENPNSAKTTANPEELFNPRKDSGPALNSVKTEAIFCNGVKVVLGKPERKILLEKKIAVERIKMGASKKTITIVIVIITIIITIIVIIDRDCGAGWDEGK